MKNKTLLYIIGLLHVIVVQAQVNQKVLVEHFTNSRCSVCANRNPGFYSNLNNQNEAILHVAIHPSSPYSNCLLNQHNKSENDARTNYYGIYGATPQLVIQGTILASISDYASASIFTPFSGKVSEFSISTNLEKNGDSLNLITTIKTVASHTFTKLNLVAYAIEDQLNYASPNGETVHYDVFRKNFYPLNGITINVPINIGDSIVYSKSIAIHSVWKLPEIYGMAFLQDTSSKQIIQVERSSNLSISIGLNKLAALNDISIYPNPSNGFLNVTLLKDEPTQITIFNSTGSLVFNKFIQTSETIDVSSLVKGLYFVELANANGKSIQKIQLLK